MTPLGVPRLRARTMVAAAATMSVLITGSLQLLATSTETAMPSSAVAPRFGDEFCVREVQGIRLFLNPCVREGEPFPADLQRAFDELIRERECLGLISPAPSLSPIRSSHLATRFSSIPETRDPSESASPTPDPTESASPTPSATQCPSWTPSTPPTTAPPTTPPPTTAPPTTAPPTTAPPTTAPPTTAPPTTAPPTTAPPTTAPPTTAPPTTAPPTTAPPTTAPPTTAPPTTAPPTTAPPTTAPPSSPPAVCPATATATAPALAAAAAVQQLNAAERQTLDEALKDRVKTRDPRTVPETCRPVVLVAAGDSLTAAHHQTANHLQHCENTESDPVRPAPMKGNNSTFSYAGKYFDANRQIVEYYNFARTGFSTKDILAAGPDDVDGCNQPWSRRGFPIDLAKSAVEQAKRNQHAAWFVTTGGINDTNWVDVMSQTLVCRALETTRRDRDPRRFTWTANNGGGRADIVPHGGTCIATAALLGEIHREVVPRFDGKFDSVSLRAKRIVDTMLQAGADRVIWMLYYDLNPARIQIRHLVERQIAQRGAGFFDINRMGEVIEVVDPDWAAASRDIRNQLNLAIIKQLPQNLSRAQWSKVRIVAPYLETAEIQQTARGGSPHPNEAGHQKLAKLLDNAANAPGTGKALRSKVNNRYVAAGHGGDQPLIARSAFPGPWESFEFIRVGGTDAKPHVALLSLANHNFVATEQAGAQPLIANRAVRGAWETFELSRNADDGTISLKSLANNKFVTATNAGNGPLLASCGGAECPALWERFYETPSPSGYALRARVNTKHVTVPNLQGGPLYASEAADGPTTTFHVLDVRHPELDRTKRFVALMSHTNNRFVTAVEAGTKPLMAAVPERPNMWKEELGKIRWEIFEVYSNADGSISLRALANNKFVTAQDAGNGPLLAARGEATPDAWEKFDLIPWNTPPEHLP